MGWNCNEITKKETLTFKFDWNVFEGQDYLQYECGISLVSKAFTWLQESHNFSYLFYSNC